MQRNTQSDGSLTSEVASSQSMSKRRANGSKKSVDKQTIQRDYIMDAIEYATRKKDAVVLDLTETKTKWLSSYCRARQCTNPLGCMGENRKTLIATEEGVRLPLAVRHEEPTTGANKFGINPGLVPFLKKILSTLRQPYSAVLSLDCGGHSTIDITEKPDFKSWFMELIGGGEIRVLAPSDGLFYVVLPVAKPLKCKEHTDLWCYSIPVLMTMNNYDQICCHQCFQVRSDMKLCSLCKGVQYCDKKCQQLNWSRHRSVCAGYKPKQENRDKCANCANLDANKKCSKCKKVYYCTAECQRKHWALHKKECV